MGSDNLCGDKISDPANLKQHYVTLTATHCFEKCNLAMQVNASHKTAALVKSGHILQRKCPLVFPLMFDDCSVCVQPFNAAELSPADLCRGEVPKSDSIH